MERQLPPRTEETSEAGVVPMTNAKRFPADEAIHHTGQRGPMVVLASDHDAETDRLQRHLDSRNEQIDGYERQLGIDKAGAEHTIGSEIERLTRERDVSRAAIEQLHAAVKTAQELAATRLMDVGRLTRERHEYKIWWERDSKSLGTALNDLSLERACKQDLQAQLRQVVAIGFEAGVEAQRRSHEPSEQLPAELAWGLESKLPGEDWKVYWALYSDRARAEQAAKNGRPEGTEWRVVTYARMPDGASGDASSESSDHPFDVACACQLCRDKLAEWNAEKSSEQQENKNGN